MTKNDKLKVKTPRKTTKKIKQEQHSKQVRIQFFKESTGSCKGTKVSENIDWKPPLNNGGKGTSDNNNRRRPFRRVTKGMIDSSLFIILVLIFISF